MLEAVKDTRFDLGRFSGIASVISVHRVRADEADAVMKAWILTAISILVIVAAPVSANDLDAILERTRIAYGSDTLPAEGTMIRSRGKVRSNRRGQTGNVTREVSWPDYLRIEIAFENGQRETRLMLGEEGWRDGAAAPGPMISAMRLQAARLSLPMILWWERERLTDLGPARREDGIEVRRLRIGLADDLALFVEIEAGSGRVLRSAGVMRMGGAEMSFGAVYSDFRPFSGVRWPAREDQSAMGQAIGWTVIEQLELGLPWDSLRP